MKWQLYVGMEQFSITLCEGALVQLASQHLGMTCAMVGHSNMTHSVVHCHVTNILVELHCTMIDVNP